MPEIEMNIIYTRTIEAHVTRTIDVPQEVLDRTKGADAEELADVLHEYLTDHPEVWDKSDDEAAEDSNEVEIDEIEVFDEIDDL
jgi:hypothetical protein